MKNNIKIKKINNIENIIRHISNEHLIANVLLGAAKRGMLCDEKRIEIIEKLMSSGKILEAAKVAFIAKKYDVAFECYKKLNDGSDIERAIPFFERRPSLKNRINELYSAAYDAYVAARYVSSSNREEGIRNFVGAARCAEKSGNSKNALEQYSLAYSSAKYHYNNDRSINFLEYMARFAARVGKAKEFIKIAIKDHKEELAAKIAEEAGKIDKAIIILEQHPYLRNEAAKIAKRAGLIPKYKELSEKYLKYCETEIHGLKMAEKFCKDVKMYKRAKEYALISDLEQVGLGFRN